MMHRRDFPKGDPEDWPVEPVEEDPEAYQTGRDPESEDAEQRDTGDRERLGRNR
jgi:hypothetical protein